MAVKSSLACVFGPEIRAGNRRRFDAWKSMRLDSEEDLGQLHARFWGKSMADEEEEWRNAQPLPSMGSLENKDQDGDDDMGEGGDEGMDGDKGTDEGNGPDKDDDVIRGCYMLDIGIETLDISQMWIRAEYIRIFDHIEDFFNRPGIPPGRAPCAVITGQPGIGKSVWIYYALRRYLAEKKPVIWYNDKKCYLFVDEGVYEEPPNYTASQGFTDFVRTLVDSDERGSGLPERLVVRGTRHAVIYTTSPCEDRWKRLHKTVRVRLVIMNPWVRKEILRAAQALSPDMEKERINDVFDRFGPTPRLCIDYLSDSNSLNRYEHQVQHAISNLTTEQLKVFEDSYFLDMHTISDKICLLSRESGLPGDPVVVPITRSIQSRLANQFRKGARAEQTRLYKSFAMRPESRGLAGVLFEAVGQGRLQDGIELDIIPMVRLTESRKDSLPQWYSSHLLIRTNKSLEQSRQQALQQRLRIDIPKSQFIGYRDGGPSSTTPNVLYLPQLTNQVTLGSFMLFDNFLYIFQFTIGENHDIKPDLVASLGKCSGLPPMACWRFVFLMEPNQVLKCTQPPSLDLRQLHPFSAVISL